MEPAGRDEKDDEVRGHDREPNNHRSTISLFHTLHLLGTLALHCNYKHGPNYFFVCDFLLDYQNSCDFYIGYELFHQNM